LKVIELTAQPLQYGRTFSYPSPPMSTQAAESITLPEAGSVDEEDRLKAIIEELEVQDALENLQAQEAVILTEARTALEMLFEREREMIIDNGYDH